MRRKADLARQVAAVQDLAAELPDSTDADHVQGALAELSTQVEAAAIASTSTAATQAADSLTLDQAATVAEFDDYREARHYLCPSR